MNEKPELARFCAEAGQLLLSPPSEDADIERDYVRLFLSPQGALCPPWQSVWAEAGDTPRLMGYAHHSALTWYRQFGFEPSNESEPADHAGLLLLFYAFILQTGATQETLSAFVEQHLKWLPKFANSVIQHSRTVCFQKLGHALAAAFPVSAALA